MSETKHTPGPWVQVAVQGGWDGVAEEANRKSMICALGLNNSANARLIAAAPDLLAALQEWMSAHREVAECGHDEQRAADEREQIAREMAAVAIAKATGATP